MKKSVLRALIFTLFVAFYFVKPSFSQQMPNYSLDLVEPCASTPLMNALFSSNPSAKEYQELLNKQVSEQIQRLISKGGATYNSSATGPVMTIPCVVHIVHTGQAIGATASGLSNTIPNPTEAQIRAAFDAANSDLNKRNNKARYSGGDSAGIKLCLATKNPSGVSVPNGAINRFNGALASTWETAGLTAAAASTAATNYNNSGVRSSSSGIAESDLVKLALWPTNKYYNIYIVTEIDNNNGGSGTQGFAYFPPGSGTAPDRAIMIARSFTISGIGTFDHEMGHALNLHHTFRGASGAENPNAGAACPTESNANTDGDMCADIPLHVSMLGTACKADNTANACQAGSTFGQFQYNYMNYTNCDDNTFSPNQVTRMRTTFTANNVRKNQVSSSNVTACGCDGTNKPLAMFGVSNTKPCIGSTVTLLDSSLYAPNGWTWTITPNTVSFVNGTTKNSQNPQVTFDANGTYTIKMKVLNTFGADSIIRTNLVTTVVALALPYSQDFENATFPPTGIKISTNIGSQDVAWTRSTSASGFGNGTASAALDNNEFGSQAGINRNSILLPLFDFSTTNNPILTFDLAYERFYSNTDSLVVYYSIDCGNTFIRTNYIKGFNNLLTTNAQTNGNCANKYSFNCSFQQVNMFTKFIPLSNQWRTETVSLSNAANLSAVIVKIERYGGSGGASNSLYIDNINVAELPIPPVANFTANATQICSGDSVQFTDLSTNNPTSWAWTFAGGSPSASNLKNPKVKFTGAGNSTVTLTATNAAGTDGESKTNYISITTPSVSGTAASASNTICAGSNANINLSGFTGTIQWQSATGSNAFSNISGQTTASLNTGSLNETTKYRAIVTNGVCASATSNEVTITVSPATAAGTATPTSSSLCSGSSTAITLAGNTGTIQWQSSINNIDFADISNQTASVLNTGNLTQTIHYRAVVTSGVCASQNTNTVTITVSPNTVAGTASANNNEICTGGSAVISLVDNIGTVQWQSSTDNLNFTNINGQTAQTLNTGALNQTMYYRAVVKSGVCASVNTNTVTINVVAGPVAGTASVPNANLCQNSSTTVTLSSSTGSIQWESSANGTVYANIVGQTNATINTGSLNDTIFYRAKVGGGTCPEVFSNAIKLNVSEAPVAGNSTTNTSVICGSGCATLTITGSKGSIQWFMSTDNGVNFTLISGANAATYQACPTAKTQYKARLSNTNCADIFSNTLTIDAIASPMPGSATADNGTVCKNTFAIIRLASSVGAIQWQSSSNNTLFIDISNQNKDTLKTSNLTATTYFRAKVGGGSCPEVFSNSVEVNISESPVAGTASAASMEVCSGSCTDLSLANSFGNIQWQVSTNGGALYTNINSAINNTTNVCPTQNSKYRAKLSTPNCTEVFSNIITINVTNAPIAGSAAATDNNFCGSGTTNVNLTGSTGTIQWQKSTNNITFINIQNATSASVNTGNLIDTTYFRAKLNTGAACAEVFSNVVTINISETPIAGTIASTTNAVCNGGCADITLNGSRGLIQWLQSADNGMNFTDISGENGNKITVCPTVKTQYKAKLSNANCADVLTETYIIDVIAQPMPGTASSNRDTACKNTDVLLQLAGSQGPIQWQTSINGIDFTNVTDENANTYFISGIQATSFIRARVGGGTCPEVFSNSEKIVVTNPALSGTASIAKNNVCEGDNATINLSGFDGNIQWQKENQSGGYDNVLSENTSALSLSNVTESAKYRAQVSKNGCIPELSNIIEINSVPRPGAPTIQGRNSVCAGEMTKLTATTGSPNNNYEWYDAAEGGALLIASDVINVSPSQTITYYAQTLANGCESVIRTAYTVKVNQNPTILSIVSDTVCRGDVATLAINTSNNKDIVKWYNSQTGGTPIFIGKTLVTPRIFNNKTYFAETESDQGCNSNIRIPVNVTVRNSGIDISADKNDVGTDYLVQFTSLGTIGSTYFWDFGDGSTSTDANPKYQYSTEGVFTVRLIAINNGCKDTVTKQQFIHVDKALFVNNNNQGAIKLYPNPATDIIYLENINEKNNYDVKITDIIGRTIAIVSINNSNKYTFDVSGYEAGSYQMQIISKLSTEVYYFQKR